MIESQATETASPEWNNVEADAAADEYDQAATALEAAQRRHQSVFSLYDAMASKRGYTTYVR